MTELTKATLTKLTAGDNPQEIPPAIPVQFNPASLRLSLANQVEGGRSQGRQQRQFNGQSSTDLTFDLVFDTADEAGSGGRPRSVREKTALVEQFVVPQPDPNDRNRRLVPPRVRFQWGDLKIDGIISSLTLDFDLFAPDGTPLRAKMGVSIKEQDARYEIRQREQGQGAGSDPSAGAGPGSAGGGSTDRTGTALDGESAADFAARNGIDPAAWRGVAAALEGTLSLEAGLEIDFAAGISIGAGLSAGFGFEAGASLSLEASFGLEPSGIGAAGAAGFALAAAGGVAAAVETVAIARSEEAASAARSAFSAPAPEGMRTPPIVKPRMPDQPRAPLQASGPSASPVLAAKTRKAEAAPPPPLADPRARSYGFGVPLRPRRSPAGDQRIGAISGRAPLRPYVVPEGALVSRDPGAAPWESLPAIDPTRDAIDQLQRRIGAPCSCKGACKCGGRSCR